jgi:uncharacterized membrane protein YdbT with pleckstrin-like domain
MNQAWRAASNSASIFLITVSCAVFFAMLPLGAPPDEALPWTIIAVVVVPLFLVLAIRAVRMAGVVTEEAVTVRGAVRTKAIPW